jgi:hypothetical protein
LRAQPSKFFRPNHRHEQVDEEQQRDDADDDGFHSVLPPVLAEASVKGVHTENDQDPYNNEFAHKLSQR